MSATLSKSGLRHPWSARPVHFKQVLVSGVAEPRHALAKAQDGVVFKQAIEDVRRFPRRARNDARPEHGILIRGMQYKRWPRARNSRSTGDQRAFLDSKALAVG